MILFVYQEIPIKGKLILIFFFQNSCDLLDFIALISRLCWESAQRKRKYSLSPSIMTGWMGEGTH